MERELHRAQRESVVVFFGSGIECGVERGICQGKGAHDDIGREELIESMLHVGEFFSGEEVDDLSPSVNPGVGAAGRLQGDGMLKECCQRFREDPFDAAPRACTLPSLVMCADVGHEQSKVVHFKSP